MNFRIAGTMPTATADPMETVLTATNSVLREIAQRATRMVLVSVIRSARERWIPRDFLARRTLSISSGWMSCTGEIRYVVYSSIDGLVPILQQEYDAVNSQI